MKYFFGLTSSLAAINHANVGLLLSEMFTGAKLKIQGSYCEGEIHFLEWVQFRCNNNNIFLNNIFLSVTTSRLVTMGLGFGVWVFFYTLLVKGI